MWNELVELVNSTVSIIATPIQDCIKGGGGGGN